LRARASWTTTTCFTSTNSWSTATARNNSRRSSTPSADSELSPSAGRSSTSSSREKSTAEDWPSDLSSPSSTYTWSITRPWDSKWGRLRIYSTWAGCCWLMNYDGSCRLV
jgi:hypothetical protein